MTTRKLKKAPIRKSRAGANSHVVSLLGKYRGKGLLNALTLEKKREREI